MWGLACGFADCKTATLARAIVVAAAATGGRGGFRDGELKLWRRDRAILHQISSRGVHFNSSKTNHSLFSSNPVSHYPPPRGQALWKGKKMTTL